MNHCRYRWAVMPLFWLFLAGGCAAVPPQDMDAAAIDAHATQAIPAAEMAADFALTALDGSTIRLSDLRGRWVLVNFWATWCAPCRDEMPYLEQLATTHADTLTVLAVNMRESKAEVASFVEEIGGAPPVLLQPDDATLLAYGVRVLPLSILIDPTGVIERRIAGPTPPGVVETVLSSER